jgi:hypothetical protein
MALLILVTTVLQLLGALLKTQSDLLSSLMFMQQSQPAAAVLSHIFTNGTSDVTSDVITSTPPLTCPSPCQARSCTPAQPCCLATTLLLACCTATKLLFSR